MTVKQAKLVSIALVVAGVITHTASAQQSAPGTPRYDLNLTYSAERAKLANISGSSFWLSGASAEAGFPVYRGTAVAFEVSGGHAANIHADVNLSKIAYAIGPRYTLDTSRWTGRWSPNRSSDVFGKALFGVVHAFDGLFPSINGVNYKATSPVIELGGGLDLALTKSVSVRLPELDYIHTSLANGGSNTQNDLRVAVGISWHFSPARQSH